MHGSHFVSSILDMVAVWDSRDSLLTHLSAALVTAACGVVSKAGLWGHKGVSPATLFWGGALSNKEECVFTSLSGTIALAEQCKNSSQWSVWLLRCL